MENHPYRRGDETPTITISGKAYGRRAILEVSRHELRWRAQKGQLRVTEESLEVLLHDVTLFTTQTRGKGSTLTWAIVTTALGMLWMNGTSSNMALSVIALTLGVALFLKWKLWPEIVLEIHTPGVVLQMVCPCSQRELCAEAARRLDASPEGAKVIGLTSYLADEIRTVFAARGKLVDDYRRGAGEGASDEEVEQYIRTRRRLAILMSSSGVFVPGLIAFSALVPHVAGAIQDESRRGSAVAAIVMSLVVFVVLSFVGTWLGSKVALRLWGEKHQSPNITR